jgi:hypothetical protein
MCWQADNTNSLSSFYCQSYSDLIPLGLPSAPTHGSVLGDTLFTRGRNNDPITRGLKEKNLSNAILRLKV